MKQSHEQGVANEGEPKQTVFEASKNETHKKFIKTIKAARSVAKWKKFCYKTVWRKNEKNKKV